MTTQIGFDLISISDVSDAIGVHGDRYLRRVYTDRELDESQCSPRVLACCFAAKEATIKALGSTREPVAWRSIELRGAKRGSGEMIRLSEGATVLARKRGVRAIEVGIGYQRDHAAAIVTIKGSR